MPEIILSKLSDKLKHSTVRIICDEEYERDFIVQMAVKTVLDAENTSGPTRELELHNIAYPMVGLPAIEPAESFDNLTYEEAEKRAKQAEADYLASKNNQGNPSE